MITIYSNNNNDYNKKCHIFGGISRRTSEVMGFFSQCYSGCLNERWIKPGECPVSDLDSGGSVVSLDRPCLEQCSFDDFCHAEYKCCRHSCGITCQPPVGLADSPGTSYVILYYEFLYVIIIIKYVKR